MSETTTAKVSSRQHPLDSSHPAPAPRVTYDVDTGSTAPPSTPRRRLSRSAESLAYPTISRRNPITLQDAKSVLRSTTESVLAPTDTESPTWHTIPLAFAVLPAIGGVLFTGGNYFITDVMLLFLVSVFLHWLVKFPWEWYHSSQAMARQLDASEAFSSCPSSPPSTAETQIRDVAAHELRFDERVALLFCFIGPLLGGWLLHAIRSQVSRPSEGLVSNFNLTIFVLAAELRPVSQVVKLIRNRSLYLQSIVHHPPISRVEVLTRRLEELQMEVKELALLTAKAVERDPDLDALNRAVRRYEKKEAIHSAHTENRILEIDNRLNDVLTLAAAASARQNETTFSIILFEWTCAAIVIPFTLTWKLVSLPAKAVETVAGLRRSQLLLKGEAEGSGAGTRGQQRLKGMGRGMKGRGK